jgi:hypothetical protein
VNAPGASNRSMRLIVADCLPALRRGLAMRFALEPDLEVYARE